jgi:UDPglucose--hexose-1-phosphate uridylyltransferase
VLRSQSTSNKTSSLLASSAEAEEGVGSDLAEYRRDALTGSWVIISKERAQRPHDIEEVAQENLGVTCPFCKGNEKLATPASVTYFLDGSSVTDSDPFFISGRRKRNDWQVRVIPNKYPAVDAECRSEAPHQGERTLLEAIPAFGIHEVIVESPDHVTSFCDVTAGQAELTLRAYQDRLRMLAQRPELRYAQVFKNVGAAGGASLEHSHSQIVATSILPSRIAGRIARCQEHRARTAQGLVADLVAEERRNGERIVAEVDGIVVLCPFASRFPYEVWLTTIEPQSRFEDSAPLQIRLLSQLLQRVVTAFERTLPRPAYNFCLDTAPFDSALAADYHWRLEVFPRVAKAAGFEWATGDFINPVPPEDAAAQLRPFFGLPFA